MALSVDIEKTLGDFHLRVSFEANDEIFALLGASGCGKSMTLKCIAGIERPDRGRIVLDGRVLFDSEKGIDLKPQERRAGYLFQQYALFPNMTVRQNIRCGLRGKGEKHLRSSRAAERRVDEIIHAMQLDGLEDRKPSQLSGGQQQRVALSRILINEPDIVMLDEPFSALDSHLRFSVERDVRHLMQEFGKTVLLISHDRDEVFRMADSIAIMDDGHTEVVGSKYSVFMNPRTVSGARLTGCKNVTECRRVSAECVRAEAWGMTLETGRPVDGARFVGIRMHDVYVWRPEEREAKEKRLSAIPESVLKGTLTAPCSEGTAMAPGLEEIENADTFPAGLPDVYRRQSDTRNSCGVPTVKQPDMDRNQNDSGSKDNVLSSSQHNIFHCTVTEEIENPFSYTIMLRTAKGSESFGMELNKQKWDSARRTELDVFIPPEAVLLLQ